MLSSYKIGICVRPEFSHVNNKLSFFNCTFEWNVKKYNENNAWYALSNKQINKNLILDEQGSPKKIKPKKSPKTLRDLIWVVIIWWKVEIKLRYLSPFNDVESLREGQILLERRILALKFIWKTFSNSFDVATKKYKTLEIGHLFV